VSCKQTEEVKGKKKLSSERLVLRFLYKPGEGSLWVFNRTHLSKQWFKEIPHGIGVVHN
jgi:hypothetical protein